uniref:Geminin n=1 Tax=Ixodes ricinus TaxID=34613 RepID=A0A131Y736_IXORI
MKTDKTVVKRRVLNEVQPTAYNQRLLVGASGIMRMDLKKESSNKRKQAFDVENETEVSSKKLAIQNDDNVPTKAEVTDGNASSNAYDLLVKDEVPIQYWKELAEQRRIALEKALQENEELHEQVELLTEENKHLQTIADQALPLAELVKDLTGGKLPREDEDD